MRRITLYAFLPAAVLLCTAAVFFAGMQAKEKISPMQGYDADIIRLPEPRYQGKISVEDALRKRRSTRNYKDKPVPLAEVAQLLWAAQGITDTRGFRTAPSAGALYPLEVHVVAGNVNDLAAGIYRYNSQKHELIKVVDGDKRMELRDAALSQPSISSAAVVMVLSAVYERTTAKYGERGVQYVHMEAGHAAQNACLQAAALELGTVLIGAFRDDAVKKIMKMPDREQPLYLIPVGRK